MQFYTNILLVAETGQVLTAYRGRFSEEDVISLIESTDPSVTILLDVPLPVEPCFYDSVSETFISIPEQPTQYHTFDFDSKTWCDTRSLVEIKAQKWEEIKSERNALEFGGFEFEGHIYDSDQTSQGRIMGAALSQQAQSWTTKDNAVVPLSAAQMSELYSTLQARIASVHERGRIARQLIFDAETKEQIEAIQL